MYIIIGADLVPTDSNIRNFISGEMEGIISAELKRVLNEASYRIFNLETPLSDFENPIVKCGPNLHSPCLAINGYKAIGTDLLTIANNHIFDQGIEGFNSTISVLIDAGIHYVGGGDSINSASQPFLFEFAGKMIGVYACCEHEFSCATDSSPGANPFDPLYSFDTVQELKNNSDYVIVLYHGGKEHYRYPSPQLQRICRRFAEKGADLVLCQHSHCIGAIETFADSTILYGQGNFLFDRSESEFWKTGLLVKLDDSLNVSLIPIVKNKNGVSLPDKEEELHIINDLFLRSNEIINPDITKKKYDDFASKMTDYYLGSFKGKERLLFRIINRLTKNRLRKYVLDRKYEKDELLHLLNHLSCEAHIELVIRCLELKMKV